MPRRRNTSATLDKSKQRLAGLQSINLGLDFGDGLSIVNYAGKVSGQDARLSRYNGLLAEIEALADELDGGDVELREWDARLLGAVMGRYGRDSLEYQQAGGTRLSERRRPERKPASG